MFIYYVPSCGIKLLYLHLMVDYIINVYAYVFTIDLGRYI